MKIHIVPFGFSPRLFKETLYKAGVSVIVWSEGNVHYYVYVGELIDFQSQKNNIV